MKTRKKALKFLNAAHDGKLNKLKKTAAALGRELEIGIPAVIEHAEVGDGRHAIHYAASGGRVNVLKYLIEEMKIDIDVKDDSGRTPLSWAATEERLAAVEYLLQMGANPEIPDDSKGSPLQCAAAAGKHNTVKVLLDHGAN
ncbi:hypothetical protein MKW94_017368, partial [Papaver nudicaule]|nr:hypothetical protein [Papaver nudicaule]